MRHSRCALVTISTRASATLKRHTVRARVTRLVNESTPSVEATIAYDSPSHVCHQRHAQMAPR